MTKLEALAKDCIENHTHRLVDKPTKQDIYLREESIFIQGYRQSEKRITELESTNKKISDECHKLVDSLEKKQNKNELLETQNIKLQAEVSRLTIKNAELKADNDARKFAMAMSEKVEKQLREENTKLKDVIEGYKKIAKWCDNCDKIAELKLENQKWKDEWQEQVQKATDEGYARTLQTMQLTKAKQFIRDFLSFAVDYICPIDKNYSLIAEAEQFLKDSEVEK